MEMPSSKIPATPVGIPEDTFLFVRKDVTHSRI